MKTTNTQPENSQKVPWAAKPFFAADWREDCDSLVPSFLALVESTPNQDRHIFSPDEQFERLRIMELSSHKACYVAEAQFLLPDGGRGYPAFIISPEETTLLTGVTEPVHEINIRYFNPMLTDAAAAEYLRFFCAMTIGNDSAFAIYEAGADIPGYSAMNEAQKAFLDKNVKPVTLLEATNKRRIFSAAIIYNGDLFLSIMSLSDVGFVDMLEDDLLMADLPRTAMSYKNSIRHLPKGGVEC